MIEWVAFAVPPEGVPCFMDWQQRRPLGKVRRLGTVPASDRAAAIKAARTRWPEEPAVVVQSRLSCEVA